MDDLLEDLAEAMNAALGCEAPAIGATVGAGGAFGHMLAVPVDTGEGQRGGGVLVGYVAAWDAGSRIGARSTTAGVAKG